jgi:CheY-like chemotaxis protein
MRSKTTILLAEDYEDDIALLQRAFQRVESNNVQVVRNGDEVIDYLKGSGPYADRRSVPWPGLLLIDIKMPRKSGLEVLQWIRHQDVLKRLPVVVLTSSQNIKDVNEAHEMGANSYLVKPTSFPDLVKLIRAFADYWLTVSTLPALPDGTDSFGRGS